MFKCARIFWALIMLCAFASAVGAQTSVTQSNKFSIAPRIVDQSDKGDMLANLYLAFDPDTVVDFGVTVIVVDSLDASSPKSMIIDVTGRWKGQLHSERQRVHIDAEFIFPHTSGDVGGFPDSVYRLTWGSPGDGDRYTYQSRPQTGNHFDASTGALLTVSYTEHEIHAGDHYFYSADSALPGATDSLSIGFITPNTAAEIHMFYEVQATAACFFVIREGVTITSGDTVTAFNSNRNSGKTTSAILMRNVLGAAGTGTQLLVVTIGSTNRAGGGGRSENEIVFKRNTKYLLTTVATSAVTVTMNEFWYEHTGQ